MTTTRPRLRRPLRRPLRRHRRLAAAVLLALAAAVAVRSVLPAPAGTALVTAGRDLPAGHVLAASDLATVRVPHAAVPDGALGEQVLVGTRLASPVRAGEVVTDARVSGAGLTTALPAGHVAVPVVLGAQVRPWVGVGQRLRLVPATPAATDPWAAGAPAPGSATVGVVVDVAPDAGGGLLATGEAGPVTVLVQVGADEAGALAAAGQVAAVLLPDG